MSKKVVETGFKCRNCGKNFVFPVYEDDILRYQSGEVNIQDAFPYISPGYRELMISHICPDCWDELFGFEEEEE
jgi:DNA-directed RNA polymerase subunit RPC12/RpoP